MRVIATITTIASNSLNPGGVLVSYQYEVGLVLILTRSTHFRAKQWQPDGNGMQQSGLYSTALVDQATGDTPTPSRSSGLSASITRRLTILVYSGIGLLEYLEFLEDVGMEPIMAVWDGE